MVNREALTTEGRALIPLLIKPLDSFVLEPIDFKLDTGADLTTISKKDLNILGYSNIWIKENIVKDPSRILSSAGGKQISAHYIRISISNLYGLDLIKWPFYIRPDENTDFPNLLGINVLSYFNFSFNYDEGIVEISRAKATCIKLPLLKGQEINDLSLKT